MTISAVIVTRGDVDIAPIVESIPREWELLVSDNGAREVRRYESGKRARVERYSQSADLAVYGRYAALAHAANEVVFVQDDDCVLSPESFDLLAATRHSEKVVCNMPPEFRATGFYDEHALVGFGAIFDRSLAANAFETFGMSDAIAETDDDWPEGFFNRTCDIVFTVLTSRVLVDVPYRNLEHAYADTRMYQQPSHVGERTRMLELALRVRDGSAA